MKKNLPGRRLSKRVLSDLSLVKSMNLLGSKEMIDSLA
jgi:hypothetical protein